MYERRVQLTEQAREDRKRHCQVLGLSRKTWYRLDEEVRTAGVRRREGAASHILCTAGPRTAALPLVGCTLLQIHKHPRRRTGTGLTTKRTIETPRVAVTREPGGARYGCEFRELRARGPT